MAIKSHARKDVTKKLLSLCVGIALLSGTGGVLADAADQTVAGNLDGTAVTGNTTFNTVTVKSNTEAVVKNKDGLFLTVIHDGIVHAAIVGIFPRAIYNFWDLNHWNHHHPK